MSHLWDRFVEWVYCHLMVVTYIYQLLFTSAFLCTPVENSKGLERLADQILTPVHYLLAARTAKPIVVYSDDKVGQVLYHFDQKYQYNDSSFWIKSAASIVSLPVSLPVGVILKGASYLFADAREHYKMILASDKSQHVDPKTDYYKSIGLNLGDLRTAPFIPEAQHQRKPGDEKHMEKAKIAIQEIFDVFEKNGIMSWVDCGTCLGAYRYGGIIPWDMDVDIAILETDHDNAINALRLLFRIFTRR